MLTAIPRFTKGFWTPQAEPSELDRRLDDDRAVADLLRDRVRLRHELLGNLRADRAETHAFVLQAERVVPAGLQLALRRERRQILDGLVDALQGARHDVRPEVALVGVDADPPHLLLLRGGERAETAAAGDLEDDVRAPVDLVQRRLLALRLIREGCVVGGVSGPPS